MEKLKEKLCLQNPDDETVISGIGTGFARPAEKLKYHGKPPPRGWLSQARLTVSAQGCRGSSGRRAVRSGQKDRFGVVSAYFPDGDKPLKTCSAWRKELSPG
ncbi:hypothetical protein [Dysosmobacter sp.]|uniref:hypothetical protein n=1 Tax=Dysosmobacter sp. TaxID=2591382 RepID=UPI003A9336AE